MASLPRARYFGDVVHADLVQVFDVLDNGYWLLNVVDSMSSFQMLHMLTGKTSRLVIEGFQMAWLSWGGAPVVLVVDMGPEFTSEEFARWAEFHGSRLDHTPVEAPWQNGAAERAGQAAKVVLGKVVKEHGIATAAEMRTAITATLEGLNGDVGESGYSASQMVLGRAAKRFPSCIGEGSRKLASHSAAVSEEAFSRRIALMETARIALTRLQFSRKLRMSLLARKQEFF